MISLLLLLIVLILIIVYLMTRNELCKRYQCGHKRKDHTFKYWEGSHDWSISDCKIPLCICMEFLD